MASRFQLANSIREASLGDSIMADIEASIKSSDSASRGKGAVTAARYLADTDDKISTMKRRALGARTDAGIAPKEDNFVVDKLSGLARDWMTSMMGDADDTEVDNQERLSSLISEEAAKPLDDNTSPKERFLRTGKAPIDVLDVPYVPSDNPDDAPITYSGDQAAGASGRTAAIDAALKKAQGEEEEDGPLSPDDMPITRANTDFPSRIGMDNTRGLMSKTEEAITEEAIPEDDLLIEEEDLAKKKARRNELIDSVFKAEGGYSKDKNDTGNYHKGKFVGTNHGISAPVLAKELGRDPTVLDMKDLTKDEAREIAAKNYYDKFSIDTLPEDVQEIVFHATFMGETRGVRAMQNLLGLEPDGLIGPKTQAAMENASFTKAEYRDAYLKELEFGTPGYSKPSGSWSKMSKGWTNRYNKLAA